MFEALGGVSAEQINEINQQHAINHLTLIMVLTKKGLIDDKELEVARQQATHIVEQEWARKKEEAEKEFAEKYPHLKEMLNKFGLKEE